MKKHFYITTIIAFHIQFLNTFSALEDLGPIPE